MQSRPLKNEQLLMTELWDPNLADNVRAWIKFVWPWGKPGSPLEHLREPYKWQIAWQEEVTDHIRQNKILLRQNLPPKIYRSSVSAGRGIGKTAGEMMFLYWFMSTRLGGTAIITANNEDQLKTKTWAELGVWHTMAMNSHWFDRATLSLKPAQWLAEAIRSQLQIDTGYYYAVGLLWDKDRPEAFAGAHNPHGLLVNFQEAIGIPKPIWTVTDGFFAKPVDHRYHFVSFNPRINNGPAIETLRANRARWHGRIIDARTVENIDLTRCQEVIEEHGINSVEACAEVTGEIPGQSVKQWISQDLVNGASDRPDAPDDRGEPYIFGVDVARFGDDDSVIWIRKGRDARNTRHEALEPNLPAYIVNGQDTVELTNKIVELANDFKPRAICVDAGGIGGGVYDQLRARGFGKITHAIDFGEKAEEPKKYANRRMEIWARMKAWLAFGSIPKNRELKDDLSGPEYGFQGERNVIILESKESMKDRGLASPDRGDALALTFAVRVARLDLYDNFNQGKRGVAQPRIADGVGDAYDPFDNR